MPLCFVYNGSVRPTATVDIISYTLWFHHVHILVVIANTTTIRSVFDSCNTTAAADISSPHTKLNQNYYYNEYREGIIEIANSLLKILTNRIVDETMVAAAVKLQ
jgi:hypothetical protein